MRCDATDPRAETAVGAGRDETALEGVRRSHPTCKRTESTFVAKARLSTLKNAFKRCLIL